MLTTVQDLGRWGHQSSGVPVAGPMDEYSHRLANWLVGNEPRAAALEVTLIGPELEARADLTCAVAGARFALTVDDTPIAAHAPFVIHAGARLRFRSRETGARAALAVRGGIAVEPILGSRSTSLSGRVGPFGGRALIVGDILPIGSELGLPKLPASVRVAALPIPDGGARIGAMTGPQEHMFTAHAYDTLFRSRFTITQSSNRMGYRLEGPVLRHEGPADILSDATPIGSIQVPASGQPILLMADRQTTGGYPKIATVIGADMPIAGQLAPGDWIEFRRCTREEALDARRARFGALEIRQR
jgi:antagonist of KipI